MRNGLQQGARSPSYESHNKNDKLVQTRDALIYSKNETLMERPVVDIHDDVVADLGHRLIHIEFVGSDERDDLRAVHRDLIQLIRYSLSSSCQKTIRLL